MNKIGKIEFRKIKRISPSQFYSMKNCAYKSLLAEAFGKKPLLPLSPNAYLGTVLHKILELISKGEIINESDFAEKFDYEVFLMEKELTEKGYSFLVPLQMSVRDFGIKKVQLKKHLRITTEASLQKLDIKYTPEKWLESKDKLIGGKIDLLIIKGDEIEIVDFKTGAIKEDIFDDNGEYYQDVKNEYQVQLKLYAYLLFDCLGKFPTRLSLVDIAKQKFNVIFTNEECATIFDEAKRILLETNNSIDTHLFKANPNEANCKYCLYRPACSYYLQFQETENVFNDICGLIINVIQYRNGNVSVFIKKGQDTITITGFTMKNFEFFNNSRNRRVNVFNLRKEATEFVYSATKTTMIYD